MLRVYPFEPRTGTRLDYAAESMNRVRPSAIKELRFRRGRYWHPQRTGKALERQSERPIDGSRVVGWNRGFELAIEP
ncbi:MAG: hypothetical protein ACI9R3_005539 [Verrucomicrobiales bacterium]|jgi:hypothetical protein